MAHTFPLDDSPSLFEQQAPADSPQIEALEVGTDLLLAPGQTADRLRHFSEEVYSLEAESHLVRLLKVLMGDAGAGQVRKRFLAAHFQSVLQGSHFYDLDRFYGSLFGLGRLSTERLSKDPYSGVATPEEWRSEQAKDGSYRARIEQFARAIGWGATATGMELLGEALLGVDCDVYESWVTIDTTQRTYGQIESVQGTYGAMEAFTYGALESTNAGARNEFTIRPRRQITLEESRNLRRVGEKVKPAEARMLVDPAGMAMEVPVTIRGTYADSEHWEVVTKVTPRAEVIDAYPTPPPGETQVEVPCPVFTDYQGAACTFNLDISRILTYALDIAGNWAEFIPVNAASSIVSRVQGQVAEIQRRVGADALRSARGILAGRAVSDGILVAALYGQSRTVGRS